MKQNMLVITASENNMQASISAVFEKCAFFLLMDNGRAEILRAVQNPYQSLSSGGDIFCAQYVIGLGAQHLLTGRCTSNAMRILTEANVSVTKNVSGPVRQAIEAVNHLQSG